MIEVKPPKYIGKMPEIYYWTRVSLAGSIEMGKAINWQTDLTKNLSDLDDLVLYNPRRDNWDSSWVQSIDNPQFNEQVTWELDHIDFANLVVFVFDPKTMSPITLMELGLVASIPLKNKVVYCPEGFWRKGNVDILCRRNMIPQVNSMEELTAYVREFHRTRFEE